MTVNREQLDLICHIYDAALDQTAWTGVLDDLAMQSGAIGSTIGCADIHKAVVQEEFGNSLYSAGFFETYNHRFREEGGNEYQNLLRCPVHRMTRDTEVLAGEKIPAHKRPTLQFLRDRYGIGYRSAARLNKDGAWIGAITLQHHVHHGPMTDKEAAIMDLFLPHVAKTVELTRPFLILKSRFQSVIAALDRFHIGIFILSSQGQIILRNREADRILDLKDGLCCDHSGQLLPTRQTERNALREAVQKAAATARAEGDQAETLLVLPRRSQGDPFLVEVAPIRDRDGELDRGFSGAMVFAIDPMHTDMVSTEGMKAIYNLTPAESEIGRLIVEGLGTDEVAETRNVSRETVRTHVKRLLEKTGTKNRTQLVRLALSVNLPIDELVSNTEDV